MLAIFFGSDQNHLPSPDGIPFFDKFAHFGAFGLLAMLWARALFDPRRPGRTALLTILLVSGYGAADEFHQSFRPGRSVEFADWVVDTLGAITAAWLYCFQPAVRRLMDARPGRRARAHEPETMPMPSAAAPAREHQP